VIGGNFEVGIAYNIDNGASVVFARAGASMGYEASIGLEGTYFWDTSLEEFIGENEFNSWATNACEIEGGREVGVNVSIDPTNSLIPTGVGANISFGAGVAANFTMGTTYLSLSDFLIGFEFLDVMSLH
jgi:hypothetical protein